MWTCQCGEQIEDQFDACWRCSGRPADASEVTKSENPLPIKCLRCQTSLDHVGKKQFLAEGGFIADLLEAYNRENFDLYACPRCGHVEFFLTGVGEELRPNDDVTDVPKDKIAGGDQNPSAGQSWTPFPRPVPASEDDE